MSERTDRFGVPREARKEVINILAVAAGFPVALNAAAEMRRAFTEFDEASASNESASARG